jgi:glc operon protein GlcG
MSLRLLGTALLTAIALSSSAANAQNPPAPAPSPLDAVPEKMPFNIPYGTPISAARAEAVIQAASAEATKRGWPMNIAVVDAGGNLVSFLRMDGAQLASIAISEHKARVAAKFRRPTKAFEDAMQKSDIKYIATLDDIVASRGGIPLVEDGKLIGAVGCSGATGSQDEVICTTGAAVVNK